MYVYSIDIAHVGDVSPENYRSVVYVR